METGQISDELARLPELRISTLNAAKCESRANGEHTEPATAVQSELLQSLYTLGDTRCKLNYPKRRGNEIGAADVSITNEQSESTSNKFPSQSGWDR